MHRLISWIVAQFRPRPYDYAERFAAARQHLRLTQLEN